jgi:predicted ATPase/signal transduction histidine kinase/tRNA A-37 threonylcarbamoyl transferase component Bud32
MLKVKGFQILEELHNSNNSLIYKAINKICRQKVILKILKDKYPNPHKLFRYKQEYEFTNSLPYEGIIKSIELIKTRDNHIIVFEDTGATSLNTLFKKSLDIKTFLNISIKISEILWNIHRNNIIHKDINPSNIIYKPETGEVKIIDFGISTRFSNQNLLINNFNILEGTLLYMSPEQTGRMNRTLDYRSDFYSLGLTFYELLAGERLFESSDPLEIIHFHIARESVLPAKFKKNTPVVLNKIILKLLAKDPEERYQSALGIKTDLENCLDSFEKTGKIIDFKPGEKDISFKFCLTQKLFGREKETEILINKFEKVKNGSTEIILLAGYSGIGKTSLFQELFRLKRGTEFKKNLEPIPYFCKGKFEQFSRNIPYSAISQACSVIINQILKENEEELKLWSDKLNKALGGNARLIIDLVPELEKIIGNQPALNELNSKESQNRFQITFVNFIKVFARPESPVIFFLDDMQWSDSASLQLLQNIILSDINYFLLLGAYRDNEVNENHSLMIAINDIEKIMPVTTIYLQPLSELQVKQIIDFTLKNNSLDTSSLANLVFRKSSGNPFFTNEILKSIYDKEILSFNFKSNRWAWSQEKLENLDVSENVISLILEKFKQCSSDANELLRITSCLGSRFTLKTLVILIDKPLGTIINALKEVMIFDAIIPVNHGATDWQLLNNEILNPILLNTEFRFQHDKVQQAAYLLNEKQDLKYLHISIGRLLFKKLTKNEIDAKIIEIVEQFNHGKLLIKKVVEKLELAFLNLEAGKKARASAAYRPAMEYFKEGIGILPVTAWKNNYQLTFELFKSFSECAYICGEFEIAEENAKILINKSLTNIEKAEIYYIQSVQYTTIQKLESAVEALKTGLSLLGVNLPGEYTQDLIIQQLQEIQINLEGRKIKDLINENEISSNENKLIAKLLQGIFLPAYSLGLKNLLAYFILKGINLCLLNGNVPESAYIFNGYAHLTGHIFADLKTANEIGELSLALIEKFDDAKSKAVNLFTNISFVQFWNKRPQEVVKNYKKVIETGLQTGDLIYTSYACTNIIPWDNSLSLAEAIESGRKYLKLVKSFRFQDSIDVAYIFQNLRLNFIGETNSLFSLSSNAFNEEETLLRLKLTKNNLVTALYHIYKIQPCFYFENYELARYHVTEADKVIEALSGQAHMVDFTLFSFLTYSALYPGLSSVEKKPALEMLENYLVQMTVWSDNMPANFEHLKVLMQAEIASLKKKIMEADELYQKAIYLSEKNSFMQHEALANELAAKHWQKNKKENFSQVYLKNACYSYEIWGATAKVRHLKEKYPSLMLKSSGKISTNLSTSTSETLLDLETIFKSSEALLSEKSLEVLLEKMIKLIIENGGAEKGILILPKNDKWYIEAEYNINSGYLKVLQSIPLGSISNSTPDSILYYTIRTGERKLFNNIQSDENFGNDPYILKYKPLSVLSMPLIHQGKVQGVLYLENNLATDAFNVKHMEMLGILSVQAAISLENALLYEELEHRVKERTIELLKANENLRALNHEKNELLDIVTHNLKSPLGSIVGFASSINQLKDLKQNEIELYSAQILSGGKRMLEMIGNLLDINAIEEENYKLVFEKINLVLFIDDLLINYMDQVRAKQIKLDFVYPDEIIFINLDEAWLAQILDNLISNAIKFSKPGKNILISLNRIKEKIQIKVIDQGPGLNKNDQKRLFQKFARLSAQPTGGESSSGLGLSIVKKMVEIMGGKVYCQSKAGQGSVFILEF